MIISNNIKIWMINKHLYSVNAISIIKNYFLKFAYYLCGNNN